MRETIIVGKPSEELFIEFFKRMIDRKLDQAGKEGTYEALYHQVQSRESEILDKSVRP